MPEADEKEAVVQQWLKKAENDLKNAVYTIALGKDCPTDTVCFHTQQCVEKYLKALLAFQSIDFPKTHDISELIALLPSNISIHLTPEEQERLTDYATVTRYPGDYDEIPLAETRRAIRIARRVRNEIRKLFPKELFGRRKS